ncbi:MAG: hypothetical protein ACK4FV_02290 [Candidatus Nitrosocaldus sp.]
MYYETMRIGSKYSISKGEDSVTIVRMMSDYFEKVYINKDGYVNITMNRFSVRFSYPKHLSMVNIGEISEILEYEGKRYMRDSLLIERINRMMYDLIKYYHTNNPNYDIVNYITP